MSPTQILSQNLAKIFEIAGTNASQLSALCHEAGLTASDSSLKTTFSRILNDDANIRMGSLEVIFNGIRRLPGFENFKLSDLFDENFTAPKASITEEQLEGYIEQLFFDLKDLQFIEIKTECATVHAIALLIAKKHGIDVIKKSETKQLSAIR